MPGPGLIAGYLDYLSARLPGPVADEVADGLHETYRRHLALGLPPDAAGQAAIAEFGPAELIVAEFTRAHPARSGARTLLGTGPAVGACWAAALVTGHAWTWQIPAVARIAPGLALAGILVALASAALGTRYRSVTRTGTAGCVGVMILDAAMITGVLLVAPALPWTVAIAMLASAARLILGARLLCPLLVTR